MDWRVYRCSSSARHGAGCWCMLRGEAEVDIALESEVFLWANLVTRTTYKSNVLETCDNFGG